MVNANIEVSVTESANIEEPVTESASIEESVTESAKITGLFAVMGCNPEDLRSDSKELYYLSVKPKMNMNFSYHSPKVQYHETGFLYVCDVGEVSGYTRRRQQRRGTRMAPMPDTDCHAGNKH